MGRARTIATAALLVALVAAGAFVWTRSLGRTVASSDFPDGVPMVCVAEGCGKGFTTTVAEIARIRRVDQDAPVPCPACAGPTVAAEMCPECGGFFPADALRGPRGLQSCPHCGKPLPRATDPG